MYLESIELDAFRSCNQETIHFHEELTLLVGENNAGKSNVLDAIRLVTETTFGRRDRYAEPSDIFRGLKRNNFTLRTNYADLSNAQKGLLLTAVPDIIKPCATFGFRYTAPTASKRRGSVSFWPGLTESAESEPEARRELIRHVYLPALRDAQRVLASGNAARVAFLLRQLATDQAQVADFEKRAREQFRTLEEHELIRRAQTKVGDGLLTLTEGVRSQKTALRFSQADLNSLARSLNFWLGERNLDPAELFQSGLGYANLLYMATVIVELQAAKDADLTLFLVEEPEAHLHPQLQATTLDFLLQQARESRQPNAGGATGERRSSENAGEPEGRIQVIASTHSPHLASAVSIEHLVVLRSGAVDGPASWEEAGAVTTDGEPTPPSSEEDSQTPKPETTTVSIPIARLGLSKNVILKVDRYLNALRSSLLFSRTVVLVEGLAEALLLPVLAKLVIFATGGGAKSKERAAWSRFVGTALVPIEGVDFEPYIRLLLTASDGGHCISDKVIVVTDRDPELDSDRKESLEETASELGATEHLVVCEAPDTFEAELFRAGNVSLLKKVFLELKPRSEHRWSNEIDSAGDTDQPAAFVKLLKETKVRKGDFAQRVGVEIEMDETRSFKVPPYLKTVVQEIAEEL